MVDKRFEVQANTYRARDIRHPERKKREVFC